MINIFDNRWSLSVLEPPWQAAQRRVGANRYDIWLIVTVPLAKSPSAALRSVSASLFWLRWQKIDVACLLVDVSNLWGAQCHLQFRSMIIQSK